MTLAAVLSKESFDNLNETLQAEYKLGDDGRYVLDVGATEGFELANTANLKKALETERHTKTELEKRLKGIGDLDVDAAKEALEFREKFKDADPDEKAKQQFESMKTDLISAHQKELSVAQKDREAAYSQLRNSLVTEAATKALQAAGGSIELLLPHVSRHVHMEREGETFVAKVVDENGVQRVGDGNGNPMTIPQLVEELKGKETFQAAFVGTGNSGSGSGSGDSSDTGASAGKGNSGGTGANGVVNRNDQKAINSSISDIAEGKVKVE